MKTAGGIALALLLAGCGGGEPAGNAAIGNGTVAAESVPEGAAPTPSTAASPLPAGDSIPGVSAPVVTPSPAPAPTAVVTEPGADAAAKVLRDYFAAIGDGRYGDAWRLWDGQGEASGMTQAAFAASFAKYAEYRAVMGVPGRIDAGAGQRYLQIPVRVTGTLRDGTPFSLAGPVTLHRSGDIDGATAEQRAWRISDSGLKPRAIPERIVPQ